jgi:hypothetical protein
VTRDRDRDVSEKIALGQANTGAKSAEALYDQRLFNQDQVPRPAQWAPRTRGRGGAAGAARLVPARTAGRRGKGRRDAAAALPGRTA